MSLPPLTEFKLVGDPPMGPGARAARTATLLPLYPKQVLANDWPATFKLVMDRWRSRIKTFRAKDVIKPKGYLLSANCAPWGFHVQQGDKDWRYCDNDFCPWCHMRKVDETYQLVEKVFRAEQERNPDVVLWSLGRIHRLPVASPDRVITDYAVRMHHEALTIAYGAGIDGLGCIWQVSIGPDRKNQWQMTSRALVLMDKLYPIIRCFKWPKGKMIESWRPEALEPVIATYLRYPVGYLRGKPDFAAQTLLFKDRLRTEKKLRFSGRTGVFRKE